MQLAAMQLAASLQQPDTIAAGLQLGQSPRHSLHGAHLYGVRLALLGLPASLRWQGAESFGIRCGRGHAISCSFDAPIQLCKYRLPSRWRRAAGFDVRSFSWLKGADSGKIRWKRKCRMGFKEGALRKNPAEAANCVEGFACQQAATVLNRAHLPPSPRVPHRPQEGIGGCRNLTPRLMQQAQRCATLGMPSPVAMLGSSGGARRIPGHNWHQERIRLTGRGTPRVHASAATPTPPPRGSGSLSNPITKQSSEQCAPPAAATGSRQAAHLDETSEVVLPAWSSPSAAAVMEAAVPGQLSSAIAASLQTGAAAVTTAAAAVVGPGVAQPASAVAQSSSGWQQRWTIVAMCFVAFILCNMDRVNMAVAILPMREQFGWSTATVGLVQSSFFMGYLVTQIFGGIWADRYGGKLVLGFGVLWWSAATALTPWAAQAGLPVLLFTRAVMGIGEGVAMPAMNNMLSREGAQPQPGPGVLRHVPGQRHRPVSLPQGKPALGPDRVAAAD
ncbi:ascorbate transporter, chloroplastic [Haematococcus lacustris]|uniref:Ascorbate transporter, chloroplastic n=1 Tax=Haematococcus lacustris TaxID=44745 RepID=A0A699ZUP9_HAELA|nr:ascorbate transporter, chloroplastic [Haematococcus lacustris]